MEELSLYELNALVRSVLEDTLAGEYWVCGELSDAKVGYGGHFYGELVQHDAKGQNIIARARLNCWVSRYRLMAAHFERQSGETLRSGLKVKLLVRVTFHENFGYSLNVQDIDPAYTLGDIAQRRMAILRQLEADGILHDNQQLPLPLFCQRIAIISSDRAAGYGDFCRQLLDNVYGLRFHIQLFPAVMQGQHVEESVVTALQAVAEESERWDAVVIIRGGGATSDLNDFDSYLLAACIAQHPLPVFTGIGHERDETVLDYVAHTRLKTPTAVAAFLVEHLHETALRVEQLHERITGAALHRLTAERQRLERSALRLTLSCSTLRQRGEHRLQLLLQRINSAWPLRLERERNRLALKEQQLKSLDPQLLLQRGYSITRIGNRLLTSADDVCAGDIVTTTLKEGEIITQVICQNKQ